MASFSTRLSRGIIAGAAGTMALDLVTYGDMALRGRPASTAPAELIGRFVPELDYNRRSGIGSIVGIGVGAGVGAIHGLIWGDRAPNAVLSGLVLGACAMAGSVVPAARLGITDPKEWTTADWLSDIIPHAIYGICACWAFNAMVDEG
jgi:hypothetical protein